MRCLEKNKIIFYYAYYVGKELIQDSNDRKTGEYRLVYTEPKKFSANISIPTKNADINKFGINENYDKIIVTDNLDIIIDESTVLWVDRFPFYGNKKVTYDYRIIRIAKSLNSLSIFIKKVSVKDNPEKFVNYDFSPNDSNAGSSGCEYSEK